MKNNFYLYRNEINPFNKVDFVDSLELDPNYIKDLFLKNKDVNKYITVVLNARYKTTKIMKFYYREDYVK